MKKKYKNAIEALKKRYAAEGFIILGIFGSFARGDETENSDIDILYEMTELFLGKYPAWDAYARIEDIKAEIEAALGRKVDLADKNALREVGKKYILPEVVYV